MIGGVGLPQERESSATRAPQGGNAPRELRIESYNSAGAPADSHRPESAFVDGLPKFSNGPIPCRPIVPLEAFLTELCHDRQVRDARMHGCLQQLGPLKYGHVAARQDSGHATILRSIRRSGAMSLISSAT